LQLSAARPQRSRAILAIGITAALAAEPAGSYEKTCSDISVSGLTLEASCNTFGGQSMPTSLDFYALCVDDIGNINGALACAGPNGCYALTCEDSAVKGDTLSARCNGQFENASLTGFQGSRVPGQYQQLRRQAQERKLLAHV
jgi:hypothetical protein